MEPLLLQKGVTMLRKLCILLFALLLLPMQQVFAAQTEDPMPYIEKIVHHYRYAGEDQDQKIEEQLSALEIVNPRQAAIWRQILQVWQETDADMQVSVDVLPDGLPQDDSLCIVVMGYRLEGNGDMKPELLQRLQVALDSAEKYPEALVICTGGSTAANAQITEAEAMKAWLVEHGVDAQRIVAETRANTSIENARYTYQTLQEYYPHVNTIALVTSEYHIPRITMIFTAVGLYDTPIGAYRLQGNAVCITGKTGNNETQQTVDNLLMIARESLTRPIPEPQETAVPETTIPETEEPETMAAETQPAPTEQILPEASQPHRTIPLWVPVAIGMMLVLVLILLFGLIWI